MLGIEIFYPKLGHKPDSHPGQLFRFMVLLFKRQ